MNILLVESGELDEHGCALIGGRRARHIHEILKSRPQDSLRAGVVNGELGIAHVLESSASSTRIRFEAMTEPPPPLAMKLVLALPRPKVLRRVLAQITSLGIKEIYLINTYRVEKPYWSSEQVKPDHIRHACLLGLEQARDSVLPTVHIERRFKPFVEDRLGQVIEGTESYVAHPGEGPLAPASFKDPTTLVIGPEGGFIGYEIDLLKSIGFQTIQLGPRILKFETAIAVLAGRMLR